MVSLPNSKLTETFSEDRWSELSWENEEFWEKIEARLRRKKRRWIFSTLVVFFILSAIPLVMDRIEKWKTRHYIRQLSEQINWIKKQAILEKKSYKMILMKDSMLGYEIQALTSCDSLDVQKVLKKQFIFDEKNKGQYQWFSPEDASKLEIPHLSLEFCYDPLKGSFPAFQGKEIVGYGIILVNDLTEKRLDRTSFVILNGTSAEISFE